MVTAATYKKEHHFNTPDRLQFLQDCILDTALAYGWDIHAWAVFSNHHHFIAISPEHPENLASFISQVHVKAASHINRLDQSPKRMVWWQYWDSKIDYPNSYMARLNYVMQNPVKHGIVNVAADYPWCSANWFEQVPPQPTYKTIIRFKTDMLKIVDDF